MLPKRVDNYERTSNSRLLVYPHKVVKQVSNTNLFSLKGYERTDGKSIRAYDVPSKGKSKNPDRSSKESRQRAKKSVKDIGLCNTFTHMFTWTLDAKKVDRYDSIAVYKKVKNFLDNASRRKNFQYLLIPELHKDGAIHMHGLCNLGDVQIKYSGKFTDTRKPIYNMIDWKLGYSTCVRLDVNYDRAVSYVTKYIAKAQEKIFGKWFLSSRDLIKHPDTELVYDDEFEDALSNCIQNNIKYFIVNVYKDIKIIIMEFENEKRLCADVGQWCNIACN